MCPRLAGTPQCVLQLGLLSRTPEGIYRAVLSPPAPTLGAESGSGKLLLHSTPLFISKKRLLVLKLCYFEELRT